jgi:hypothetical protein
MDDQLKIWRTTRLKHALQPLALSAETQLRLLPDSVCIADELALDFDHWCSTVLSNDGADLSDQQKYVLERLDHQLKHMSDDTNSQLWTSKSICNSSEWEQIRIQAQAALDAFGWMLEIPPSYSSEFAPGA